MATVYVAIAGLAEHPWTHYVNIGGQVFEEPIQTKVGNALFIQCKLSHEGFNDIDGKLPSNDEFKFLLIYHSGNSARTSFLGGSEFLNNREFLCNGLKMLRVKSLQEYPTQPKAGYLAFFKVLRENFCVEWEIRCPESRNVRKYTLTGNSKINSGFELVYVQDNFE
jgi:hypothetical protein